MENKYYLGVDGGGTKTAIGIFDENGNCIDFTVCGPLNYNFIGVKEALSNLKGGVELLLKKNDVKITAIGIGDPALDDVCPSENSLLFEKEVKGFFPFPVHTRSDIYMSLFALTFGKKPAVSIVSGTGCMLVGEDENKNVTVSGGWGRLVGEDGSGYSIGLNGIKAVLYAEDGVGEKTALKDAAIKYYNVENVRSLINVFYGEKAPDIAGFSKEVALAAQNGDKCAQKILINTAKYLANATVSLVKKCKAEVVGIYGSVLTKNMTVKTEYEKLVKAACPQVTIKTPEVSAECAAALYAKKSQGEI